MGYGGEDGVEGGGGGEVGVWLVRVEEGEAVGEAAGGVGEVGGGGEG